MADERAHGIILRTRPLTETSLIVHWLTPDLGRIATVAKGARRAKSSLRGKLDFCFEGELSFQRSRRSDLHTLREVVLTETHARLRTDVERLEQAAYFVSWIEQNTETETPLDGFFPLFTGVIREVAARPPRAATVFAFELRALEILGLSPDLEASRLGAGARTLAARLLELPWEEVCALKPEAGEVAELRQFLQGFLARNLDRIPRRRSQALTRRGTE